MPLPRRPGGDLMRVPGRLRAARRAAVEIVDRVRPDVVVGFGGYVSVPAYLAARSRGVPLVVHEGNAIAGVANKLGARFTRHVATSFPGTALPHATYIGLPVRRMISTLDRAALRDEALSRFGLAADRPTLLVTGGSQGAARINAAVSQAAPALAAAGIQVLHVVGPKHNLEVPEGAGTYVIEQYVDRMDLAYAAADAVLCRAGSNTRHRGLGRGTARGLRAAADRQRRAGAQRPPGRRRRGRAARLRSLPSHRSGWPRRCPRSSPTASVSPPWAPRLPT